MLGHRVYGDVMQGGITLKRSSYDYKFDHRSGNSGNTELDYSAIQEVPCLFSSDNGEIISAVNFIGDYNECLSLEPYNGGPGSNFLFMKFVFPEGCVFDIKMEMYVK